MAAACGFDEAGFTQIGLCPIHSIAEAARHLGISRVTLSRVVNGRAAISPDLAVRLERAGLSTARLWLAMQAAYDIRHASKRKQPRVERFRFESAA